MAQSQTTSPPQNVGRIQGGSVRLPFFPFYSPELSYVVLAYAPPLAQLVSEAACTRHCFGCQAGASRVLQEEHFSSTLYCKKLLPLLCPTRGCQCKSTHGTSSGFSIYLTLLPNITLLNPVIAKIMGRGRWVPPYGPG